MRFRLALVAMFALGALALGPPAVASTYTVTSVADTPDGTPGNDSCEPTCTLRAAIQEANAHTNTVVGGFAVADEIHFAIGVSGSQQTISPATVLPPLSELVIVDGSTQPGHSGPPLIRVDGIGPGPAMFDGLVVGAGASASEIKDLALTDFRRAIELQGSAIVTGNYIGLDPSGAASALAANDIGVHVGAGTGGTTIGDLNVAALRNVISNNRVGVDDTAGGGVQTYGNYIGTDPTGTLDRGNSEDGVVSDTALGGGPVIIGNTISGNGDDGIDADGGAGFIVDNRIGTNAAGTAALANGGTGVEVSAHVSVFGNTNFGNTISGNLDGGVKILAGAGSSIVGNLIGVGSDGITPIPNLGSGGMLISSPSGGNAIGSTTAGDKNVIANNVPWGLRVAAGTGNSIRANSVFANSGLGIDLGTAGIRANDLGDADVGANLLQNFPVITSAVRGNVASGTLNTSASASFTVDLFVSATCDPSGNGEGATYIGSTTANTDAGGNATFSRVLPLSVIVGQQITATATKTVGGNTSEFSACRAVTSRAPPRSQPPISREPDSNIRRFPGRRSARRFRRVSGTASDPDGDLARVEIAIVRLTGGARAAAKKPKRCLRLRKNGKLKKRKAGKKGRCRTTGFLKAKGTKKWSFKLKRRLPKGKYVVYSRAVDKTGKRETKFTKSDKNRRAFKLR